MAISPDLENHFHIFLLVLYVLIPISLLVLKFLRLHNIPVKDIFFLTSSLSSYSLLCWFIILFATDIYCSDECEDDECESVTDCSPLGGLETSTLNTVGIIVLPIFSFVTTFIVETILAYGFGLGLGENHRALPIFFTPTPAETVRELINRIVATGPTITAGVVEETAFLQRKGDRTSIWGLVGWDQFPYHTWAMTETPHPHFHSKQDCFFKFKDLEEVFAYQGPLIIKATLDVTAENEETKKKHDEWVSTTTARIKENANLHEDKKTKDFTEETVTDAKLWDDHAPNHLIPSIQLPSLLTNHTAYENMAQESSKFVSGNMMMEAKQR